jgi:hypothetical protein
MHYDRELAWAIARVGHSARLDELEGRFKFERAHVVGEFEAQSGAHDAT